MDGKEDLEATGARYRDLILKDPRAGDELRRGRVAFLEEVERQNAAASVRRPSARRKPDPEHRHPLREPEWHARTHREHRQRDLGHPL